jgi:biopolymer transport protein ExbB
MFPEAHDMTSLLNLIVHYSIQSWGILPLLALTFIIGLGVIFERLHFFNRCVRTGQSLQHDLQLVAPGATAQAQALAAHYTDTVQVTLVNAALTHQGQPADLLGRDLEEAVLIALPQLDRHLWVLDTCITLGPLLGLLGTIIHLIEAFSALSEHQGQNMSLVTGPIAHALVATAMGLVVAIVCVTFLNYFNKRIRMVVNQLDLIQSMLVRRFAHLRP